MTVYPAPVRLASLRAMRQSENGGIGERVSLTYRRLGDGAVLFNENTWKTHILTPSAAAIYETLMEYSPDGHIPEAEAVAFLRAEFALDMDSEAMRRLLIMLRHLRVID